ncbi:hypothetical protein COEREDRAFT_89097 [Coemansia reversa NRRL 1564]|uniref:F-box domain-containing protein n=1 Tax=Coemansia reversa (strain ATCC 12441 / NRRL 1564) TaxID=763665 RepID=A0A2G5B4U2_COERN|nr:hypothetical protein COEREDRAFT_89097 [Coemansia reversa NRRL 1564]|eukprot:PIA14025.1 hypothetical protein COEREDRAFT_89097 [Coemansia reversa NRRL 1564]
MLPHNIVQMIVQYVLDTPAYNLEEWKNMLSILAVCRRWRALALPCIFGQVFISTLPPGLCQHASPELYSESVCSEDNIKLVSNIGLITICNCRQMPKTLNIRIENPQNIISFINDIDRILNTFSVGWKNIDTLEFNIMLDELTVNNSNLTEDVDANLTLCTMRIVDALPNITHIELQGSFKNITCVTLVNKLVNCYSLQLQYLDSSFPLSITALQFSDKLEHLSLEFDNENEPTMPYIPACNLKYLSLRNIKNTSIWGSFYNRENPNYITFNKLKQLCLTFNPNMSEDADPTIVFRRLVFPALTDFSVEISWHARHLISRSVFPFHIKMLRVICPRGGVMVLVDVAFNTTIRRGITQYISNSGVYANLPLIPNFLAGPACFARHASFHIDAFSQITDDAAIMWTNLKELTIDSKISLKKLMCLIVEMPRLIKLEANYVVANNSVGDIIQPNVNGIKRSNVSLLSNSIQNLSICFYNMQYTNNQKVRFIEYIVKRIPSLQKLTIPKYPIDIDTFS